MKALMRLPLLRVLFVVAVAAMLAGGSFSQQAEKETTAQTPTILFVCEHGAAKSVIAAAYFDKLARERGLKYKAVFRGTNPDSTLSPVTEKGLKEDGINTSGWKPELVSGKDMQNASRIITLGCVLPDGEKVAAKTTDWNPLPSPSQNYQLARDEIRQRVRQLIDDLTAKELNKMMNANGTFEVKLTPQDDKSADSAIGRMLIDKQFHGDLEATSKGQMLAAMSSVKDSAGYVAIERVSGTLSGRKGSFVLQHNGTMTRGEPQQSVTVVPDSGTEQLAGLTGKMTIRIADGKHYYEFEYALPKAH